jgi:hypothetical protein
MDNPENWQHKVDKTKTNKAKYVLDTTMHNQTKRCAGHHSVLANTNTIIKTWVHLQTTGGKDEPKIVLMRK